MRDLNFQLKQLCKHNRDGSIATQSNRHDTLQKMATDLHFLGYRGMQARSLKQKHVEALITKYKNELLAIGTLKNRLAVLRWWASKINRPQVVAKGNDHYGIGKRELVAKDSKAQSLDQQKLNSRPSWLTTLGHSKDSLWSLDLFRCESILLKSHWVLVVMDQCTRRIVGFAVQQGSMDGSALYRMFNKAIAQHHPPNYLSSDNDPLFLYHSWRANLRILGIEEIKSIPYTLTSHPFVERLIGSVRRELLDQTFLGILVIWRESSKVISAITISIALTLH